MYTKEFRALTSDEIGLVSGGEGIIEAARAQLDTIFNGPEESPMPYINAFLKGVEQGKQKGKQKT